MKRLLIVTAVLKPATLAFFMLGLPCPAQDIEPRRWSHLPLGGNFAGLAYAYTEGDIDFNPVLSSDNDTVTVGCSLRW